MRKLLVFCFASAMLALAQAPAPVVLNDQRIYDLVTVGVSTAEVLRIIATAPKIDFDLRPVSTDALMKAGVSEDIIKAMAGKESGSAFPIALPEVVQSRDMATQRAVRSVPEVPIIPVISVGLPAQKADRRTRIFVGESSEWQASSFNVAQASSSYAGGFGMSHAGLMKLTVSVMKQLDNHCRALVIVSSPESADLFLRLDQSTTMWARHDDMAVFNRAGEMVFVSTTHSISKDVKKFCETAPSRP